MGLISLMHGNLMVACKGIHEAEHLMIGRGVNQQINARKRVAVFGASSVEVGVVDTESPFTIVLMDQDHV